MIESWEEYMSVEKVRQFSSIVMSDFLMKYEFGRELAEWKTSDVEAFRVRCKDFMDDLIVVIVEQVSSTSVVSRGLYSFCPELLLEGDDYGAFSLFAGLCHIFVVCGLESKDESKAAVEEYSSYVVEKRRQHVDSGRSGSDVNNVVDFLLRDYSFQARRHVYRVFKLGCLVVGMPVKKCPPVTIDLSGSVISPTDFRSCMELVQSYVLSPGYSHQSFFTDSTLDAVRAAIGDAGISFVAPGFSLWNEICGSGYDAFLSRFRTLYSSYLRDRQKSSEVSYAECSKANRRVQEKRGESTSNLGSVIRSKKAVTSGGSVLSESSATSKKSGGKNKPVQNRGASSSCTTTSRVSRRPTVGKPIVKKSSKNPDTPVYHHID